MKYTVFDTADDCTSKIVALKKAGITAIIRYDDPSQNPNSWKQIGGPEYNAILAAGMAVGIVSEWVNNHLGYFNREFAARRRQDRPRHAARRGLRHSATQRLSCVAASVWIGPGDTT